jgi:multiple sugar transport system substrate-binding protein
LLKLAINRKVNIMRCLTKNILRGAVVLTMLLLTILPLTAQEATGEEPSGEINFVFWNYGPEAQPGWEAVIAEFNQEYPDVTVNLIPVTGTNWGEYLNGTATLIAGGEQPDLMWVATEGVRLLVNQLQIALPLDEYMARDQAELEGYLDDVNPQLLDAFNVDGQQYALPYSWNPMVIYYNTARLEEAGLEPPPADWTRDQFLEYAQALTVDSDGDGTPEQYGYAFDNGGLFVSAMPWIYANGGDIVSEDFCAPTVTDPEVTDALQFMYDLIYTHKVAPGPTPLNTLFQSIQTGDVAMVGVGRWALPALFDAGFEDFNIVNWPGNPDQLTEFGVDGFPILNTSQNPEAAWAFVKFMTNESVEERLVGTVDSPLGNVPARRSVAEQMTQFPPENAMLYYDVLNGPAKLVPAPPRFNEMESIFLRYTGSIFADEMSVEDAMAAAQTELSSVVTWSEDGVRMSADP